MYQLKIKCQRCVDLNEWMDGWREGGREGGRWTFKIFVMSLGEHEQVPSFTNFLPMKELVKNVKFGICIPKVNV